MKISRVAKKIIALPLPALLCAALLFVLSNLPCPVQAGLWYRGELHAHSSHSDGDSSPAALVAEAEALGLDFFCLADHDTSLHGAPSHWSDAGYVSDKMALLYGMEWTADEGHANGWAAAPFDYTSLWAANLRNDPAAAAAAIHNQKGLLSLNHPASFFSINWKYPADWKYPTTVDTDCIEVWNGMFILPSMNRSAVHSFWDSELLKGRRITGVGGSDTHHLKNWQSLFSGIGNPTNWVWAEERSAGAILAGIKNGHVSISCSAGAPRLELAADADGDGRFETIMGDAAPARPGAELNMKLSVIESDNETPPAGDAARELGPESIKILSASRDRFARVIRKSGIAASKEPPLYLACVYKNGGLYKAWLVRGNAGLSFSAPAQAGDYFRAELMGLPSVQRPITLLYGFMIALTNPVYVAAPAQ
jgi:hypothetical protein